MSTKRFIPLLAMTLAVATLLTSCFAAEKSASGDVSASTETLTVYSGRNEDLVQPLIDRFEAQTSIDVTVRYADTAELSALLIEEGARTPADVFLSQDAGALGALSQEGLFETLNSATTTLVPAGFRSTDDTWVGVTGRARAIVYDGETLTADQVPHTVDALTEPKWSGRFGIAPGNASFQSFVTAYRQIKGEKQAEQWVQKIAANEPQIFENNGSILTAVNSGTLELGLVNHYYWYEMASEVGNATMRAKLAYPEQGDPGSIVNVTGAGILKASSQKRNAEKFIEFLLTPASQEYFAQETFEYPLVAGVVVPEGLPALESLQNPQLDLADLSSLSQTQELLRKYGLI